MKIIDKDFLNEVSEQAKTSPRLRMNYNFHQSLEDKCHRFLNAVEPGTVVPIQWVIVADADDVFAPNAFETVFRIRLYLCLILCDVALDCFPANTNSAGYLPLTQTINAMVMENLFFLVHVYHVLTNYTLQCSYESPYI
jgi:hypothetical protein